MNDTARSAKRSLRREKTWSVLGVVVLAFGVIGAIAGSTAGVICILAGGWIVLRSALRLRRPRRAQLPIARAEMRRLGFRLLALALALTALIALGVIGVLPPFHGGHRWPFLILLWPAALFGLVGLQASRAARDDEGNPPSRSP